RARGGRGGGVDVVRGGVEGGDIRRKSRIREELLIEKGMEDCYVVGGSVGGVSACGRG
ncbi:hypothetical protein ISU91_20495, partial [Leptospira borgpetersenii serovar Hardjo-bovis]|nr:hypothetical protein [Leptospira borgpetersenii serovar Hardjo-bovis]